MEKLLNSPVLEYQTDTIERVRRIYGLEKEGRMGDDVRLLREWLDKQPHILKKDFSNEYLELTIISSKGSVERAKKKIDKYCTLRTLIPNLFEVHNIKEEFKQTFEVFRYAVLPKTTNDFYRILFVDFQNSHLFTSQVFLGHLKYAIMVCEYLLAHDYYQGCICVFNLSKFNLMDMLPNLNVTDLANFFTLFFDAYGMRMQSMNLVSESKLINAFVSIIKQILSDKLGSRIRVHKTIDTVYEVVPRHLLPSDFGGKEKAICELQADWIKVISSKENVTYLKEMCEARTDEALRPKEQKLNDTLGVAGTFRMLNVD